MAEDTTGAEINMCAFAPITLPFTSNHNAPEGDDNSDQYPESLPRYFLEHYTQKGANIFDPFLGYGTTAFAAEDMGRVPYGVEADGERFEWAAGQLAHWQNIRHGDAADAASLHFPPMDFCMTSPPFMPRGEDWNPLYGGDPEFAGYDCYLERMGFIFVQVAKLMKKDASVVVHVDDVGNVGGETFTPLVQDMKTALSKSFSFEAETTIHWEDAKPDYPQTQCLVFKNNL